MLEVETLPVSHPFVYFCEQLAPGGINLLHFLPPGEHYSNSEICQTGLDRIKGGEEKGVHDRIKMTWA